jgi:hypothetical protein
VIRLLRRLRPVNPVLAVLFWAAVVVVLLAALFLVFFFLDNYLPGQGMI